MANWPATLPQLVEHDGFKELPPQLGITFRSDSGAAISRRRATAGPTRFEVRMFVTLAQRATLTTFYTETVAGEADVWSWVHPVTQAAADFHFVGQLTFQATGGLEYLALFQCEIRP